MPIKRLLFRTVSKLPLKGAEQPTVSELEQCGRDDIILDLCPNASESIRLQSDLKFKSILDWYGFVSPAVIIIEAYVDFYMSRYEKGHSELKVRNGLRVEKSFDLILQNIGVYRDYAEPIRDWRMLKPCDFYLPLLGKLEVKSVTKYKSQNRFNVPIEAWKRERPDYAVVLDNLDNRHYIKLLGAMPAKKVESYSDTEYQIPDNPSGPTFWSIPCDQLTIKPEALYNALIQVKRTIDAQPPMEL